MNCYIIQLAARPAFGGPLASQGATPSGSPFDSMPVSWMKSAYYNKNFILSPIIKKKMSQPTPLASDSRPF